MDETKSVVINYNPRYVRILRNVTLTMLAALIVFAGLGSALLIAGFLHHDWLSVVIGGLGALVCSTIVIMGSTEYRDSNRRYQQNLPAFTVTQAGIEDYASPLRVGPIAWDEIERISCVRYGGLFRRLGFLVITLKSHAPLDRAPWYNRIFTHPRQAGSKPQRLCISQATSDTKVEEILRRLNQFYLQHVQPPPGPDAA